MIGKAGEGTFPPRKRPHTLEKCCSPAGGGHRSFKSGREISVHHPLVPLTSRYRRERARDYICDDTRMVRNISAVLLVKACMNTLGLLGGGVHDKNLLLVRLWKMAGGKSQWRITQRRGDVNRRVMMADGPRTLSGPSPAQVRTKHH